MAEFKGGYAGSIIEFDLSSQNEERRKINEDQDLNKILYRYIGGRGLGVRLLFENIPRKIPPLAPENVLVYSTGPLSGTRSPTPGRFTVTSKSPLTGTISTSNSGSRYFPKELKRAGFDAFLLKGRAEDYSYVHISNEGFRLENAEGMFGLTTKEATKRFRNKYGKRCGTLTIGPAAENNVLFANIHVDNMDFFGRGGHGAIMHSKNLKGIVVKGEGKIPEHGNPDEFANEEGTAIYEAERRGIANNRITKAHSRLGTPAIFKLLNNIFGSLPTRNFRNSHFERGDNLRGEVLNDEIKLKDDGCFGCQIRCKRKTKAGDKEGHGPEYETLYALGSSLGLGDLYQVTRLNYLCNELGLDTITMGLTISCAIDMFEDGIITEEDTDGLKLTFGSGKVIEKLIRKTAYSKGFGTILAKGSYRMAKKYGHPEYSMSVNKLELAGYDPRVLKGIALVFAQSNRGACHLRGGLTSSHEVYCSPKIVNPLSIAGKGDLAAISQDMNAFLDSLIACLLAAPGVSSDIWARLLTASVFSKDDDYEYTPEDLMEVGERIYNLERWFNQLEGISADNYELPQRLLDEEVQNGPQKGERLLEEDYLKMEKEYYEVREWENGAPTEEKLRELKIIE